MANFRYRYIQQAVTVLVYLLTGRTLSYVPSSSLISTNRARSTTTRWILISIPSNMKINDDEKNLNDDDDSNEDENGVPKVTPTGRSKKFNETKSSKLSPLDVKALQQQYEALISSDTTVPTENTLLSANRGNRRESNNEEPLIRNQQEIVELHCGIPSELISILKDQNLWSNETYMVHVPIVLTSLERKRRLLEIELLQSLVHDDDDEAVHQLWSLWYSERGNQDNATQQLFVATTYSSDPNTWDQAEQLLRQLILQHGVYWVEPVNRLATLYYLQGKYQRSIDLCHIVLLVKPWHFGALSGMVGLYMQMNNITQAKKWSEKRLPSNVPEFIDGVKHSNQRRVEWVRNAVMEAKQSLQDAEQQLQLSFGKNDLMQQSRYDDGRDDSIPSLDIDNASWQ